MTLAQILSIIALLSAFGAPESTVLEVQNILLQSQKSEVYEAIQNVPTVSPQEFYEVKPSFNLDVSIRNNHSKIYGGFCTNIYIDVETSQLATITFFNPETKLEERKQSPTTFIYKPRATSTTQNLIVYIEGTEERFEKPITIVDSLFYSLSPNHIRDDGESYFTTTNGEKIDKITKNCL